MGRDPRKALTFIDWAHRKGFNGVRIFLGALTWYGQTPDSARAGLYQTLTELAHRGLVAQLTLLTDTVTGYDKIGHIQACMGIAQLFENVLVEIANEPYHPTQDGEVHDPNWLDLQGRRFVDPAGFAYAIGAPSYDEVAPDGSLPSPLPGEWKSVHLARDDAHGRGEWNMVRRIRELETIQRATGAYTQNNEMQGWGEFYIAGKRSANPSLAFVAGVLSRCFDVGYVSHAEHGLRADLPGTVQDQCHAEAIRGFTCIPFPEFLQYKNAGWTERDAPIAGADFNAVLRAYSFVNPPANRGVTVLVKVTGNPAIRFQHGWRHERVIAAYPDGEVWEIVRS